MYRELLALLLLNAGRALIMGTQHMRRYVCRQQLVPATNRRMASLVALVGGVAIPFTSH